MFKPPAPLKSLLDFLKKKFIGLAVGGLVLVGVFAVGNLITIEMFNRGVEITNHGNGKVIVKLPHELSGGPCPQGWTFVDKNAVDPDTLRRYVNCADSNSRYSLTFYVDSTGVLGEALALDTHQGRWLTREEIENLYK